MKSKGLGKGLSALLGDAKKTNENVVEIGKLKTDKTPIHLLIPNKYQPRKKFEKKQLEELAQSIKGRGIIQPIAIRKSTGGKYEIIAGERRWRAAQLAKIHEVPTVLLDADDELAAEFAVLENVQREGLNAVEEAEGYQTLIDKFQYTQDKIAEMIGKSRVYIANTLRLKKLPMEIQQMINDGLLTPGHARALIDVDNNDYRPLDNPEIVGAGNTVYTNSEFNPTGVDSLTADIGAMNYNENSWRAGITWNNSSLTDSEYVTINRFNF